MNQKEEIKKYERKIEELHAQVESEAKELGKLKEANESQRANNNLLRLEKDSLFSLIQDYRAEFSKLSSRIEEAKRAKKRGFVEYDSAVKKAKTTLAVIQSKIAQTNVALKQKLKLTNDLAPLAAKRDSAAKKLKSLQDSIAEAQRTLSKEQKKSKGIVAQATKILKEGQEKEAQVNQSAKALRAGQKKILFYLRRINKWNKSKGLKEIEINL